MNNTRDGWSNPTPEQGQEQEDFGKGRGMFCPTCGGASIDLPSKLEGSLGVATCRSCGWSGPVDKLYSVPFFHNMGSKEGLSLELINAIRRIFSAKTWVIDLRNFLTTWGFLRLEGDQKKMARELAKYCSRIAIKAFEAVIEVREELERERVGQDGPAPKEEIGDRRVRHVKTEVGQPEQARPETKKE